MKAVMLHISGKVQGVAFRYYMSDKAAELKIAGWVRNKTDGSVEAFCQGDESSVDAITEWCRLGPPHASVHHLSVSQKQPDPSLNGFHIRPND